MESPRGSPERRRRGERPLPEVTELNPPLGALDWVWAEGWGLR
jgi:hypothetical protein